MRRNPCDQSRPFAILVDVDAVDRLEAADNDVEVHSGARHHLLRTAAIGVAAQRARDLMSRRTVPFALFLDS